VDYNFGIVQGRLIQSPEGCLQWFPQEHWESEFFLASALGYNFIELIAERQYNKRNPIWTDEGVEIIKELCSINKLSLYAICNDYIIDHSLIENKDVLQQTIMLISRSHLMGIKKLILPLFEKSELLENNFDYYKEYIETIANCAQEKGILVCLETGMRGISLLKLLEYLDHPNIKCVYDTGNRVSFGENLYSDIVLLGKNIQHVHIKDKDELNNNVLLGSGKVNFYKIFQSLSLIQYNGSYTFETYRGRNPIRTAKYHKSFIEFFIKETSEGDDRL